jgi:hypothetical protein
MAPAAPPRRAKNPGRPGAADVRGVRVVFPDGTRAEVDLTPFLRGPTSSGFATTRGHSRKCASPRSVAVWSGPEAPTSTPSCSTNTPPTGNRQRQGDRPHLLASAARVLYCDILTGCAHRRSRSDQTAPPGHARSLRHVRVRRGALPLLGSAPGFARRFVGPQLAGPCPACRAAGRRPRPGAAERVTVRLRQRCVLLGECGVRAAANLGVSPRRRDGWKRRPRPRSTKPASDSWSGAVGVVRRTAKRGAPKGPHEQGRLLGPRDPGRRTL